jgi:hypothetical protein
MESECCRLSTLLSTFFAAIVWKEVGGFLSYTGAASSYFSYRVIGAIVQRSFPNLNCCRNRIDEATIAYRRLAFEVGL